jgi:ribosomal protein S18 acetylase RimI-like enzyme
MKTTESKKPRDENARGESGRASVELVDNWHDAWPRVLAAIDRFGDRKSILVDADGWLSARQNLLVAFENRRVAGYIVFRVQPAIGRKPNEKCVEARLDSAAVDMPYRNRGIEKLLCDAALARARELKCTEVKGLEGNPWC